MPPSLPDKAGQCLNARGWDGSGIVVAVSGGPDSVALFLALRELRPPVRLVLAHLNHQLRGEESDADEAFVRALHQRQAEGGVVELRCERIDIAARAREEAGNVEAVARRLRYDFLSRVAAETGCRWIATGHTADDQAETVLHRLLRGSGLRGLRGIAIQKTLAPDVTLIRPLLDVRRAEVLEYLQAHHQDYCIDRTNLDLRLTRSRIRHQLLPLLVRDYNPDIACLLAHLAGQAEAAYQVIESAAERLLQEAELPRAGAVLVLDRRRMMGQPRDLLREMFRLVWQRERWPEGAMSFEGWDRLAGVVLGEQAAIDLAGGIHARATERVVQIGQRA